MASPRVAVWCFHCPECGYGHEDLGHLLEDDEIHCIVCLETERRTTPLRRWLEGEAPPRRRVTLAEE